MPDIERYCAAHGYKITQWYKLNDKSAFKGQQQKYQDQVVADMKDGKVKVLVSWNSDRVERRSPEQLFKFLRNIKDAGGRLESTTEPMLGTEDLSSEATTALGAVIAHHESVKRSWRQRLSVEDAKSRGALYSIIPWGYKTVGGKGYKHIVPTDLARKIIPKIFQLCIDGYSLADIAAWLDAQGIPNRKGEDHWSESTVRWIIRQRAYAGRWVNRKNELIQTCEAVIKPNAHDRALHALQTGSKKGPQSKNPPMLKKLRCARCGSPMYRVKSGNPGDKRYYYRSFGKMPQRKGCGNAVPLAQTDLIVVTRVFMTSTEPYKTREWVEGTSYDDEISNVKQLLREAVEAERFADMPDLQAQLAGYRYKNETEATAGHYEYTDTGITVGDYFDGLDVDGKREYLKTHDIRAEKAKTDEGTNGIRIILDGVDHGVYAHPPGVRHTVA